MLFIELGDAMFKAVGKLEPPAKVEKGSVPKIQ